VPDLRAAAAGAMIEVSSSEVADDWGEQWKRFHTSVLLESPAPERVPGIWVRPPWEPPVSLEETVEIVIDPGQAFGTGAHATTRLCLELLLGLAAVEPARDMLLDVGTGSGVLAIAAYKLGYSPVMGLDHDRESVTAAIQNASINSATIDVRRVDVRTQTLPVPAGEKGSRMVIVANLLRPLLLDLARAVPRAPAHLIASGLLVEEVDEIVAAYTERLDLHERARRERGEWAAVWLQLKGSVQHGT
jgi:ribosomal protein L11 methyltransferase